MIDLIINILRCLVYFASDIIYNVFYRARAIGRENIPKKGGVLIASNHVSAMEVVMIPYMAMSRFSSRRFWYPAKEELFRFKPAAWVLWLLRVFPVRRGGFDYAAMKKIAELASKEVVIIFPEGTRSKDGLLHKGRGAVGKIIYDSKTTVIPTAVFNTRYCMPAGARFPNLFLPLRVVFGKPLDLTRYFDMPFDRNIARAIVKEVMDAIAKIQKEYAHLDNPPKRFLKENVDDPAAPHSGS